MNFLAHLYLSPADDDALLGSLMGDFVKGPLSAHPADAVRRGMALHRRVDTYTDAHPIVRDSRNRISAERRRYAGIMIDMFYDHFLARDWARYHEQPLAEFAQRVYAMLLRNRERLPERLARIAPYMATQDWLSSYRAIESIHVALERMGTRLTRGNALRGAAGELVLHYDALEADFRTFFPHVTAFARATAHEPNL